METFFILLFGTAAVLFAVLVLMVRQPMRAALALVAHMISLACIYATLNVHVVAIFQILIYVSAVMVFMVYTIMLLDDRDTSFQQRFSRWVWPALIAAVLIPVSLWLLPNDSSALVAPAGGPERFTFAAFALDFMRTYWFHFELATVLLLIGVLSAWTAVKEGLDG
jgi:NADH-quinone oxidoreductase subunit J